MVTENSSMSHLGPFFDNRGILRIGRILRKSNLSEEENHPFVVQINLQFLIWSSSVVITVLLMRQALLIVAHLRQRDIWIVNADAFALHLIDKCHKMCGKMGYWEMAELQQERCTEAAPITYCSVHMFRPLIIKEIRSELKRYGTLFTRFSSRDVRIEVTNSLDADPFILALRRFMVRIGAVHSIWSDNFSVFSDFSFYLLRQ